MTILTGLLVLVTVFALASAGAVWLYGRFAKRARAAPSAALAVAGPETGIDRAVAPLTEARPGLAGIAAVPDNPGAYAIRALSAREAGRSLDLMYYIWRGDLTGQLLAHELLAAADRGVRVRLLLDDINTRGLDPAYLALSGHPRIEVRLFNPARNRVNALRRGIEMLLRLLSLTRRMHNKLWIADGRLAILGGRNVGDEYFGAHREIDTSDMDALVLGPPVAEAEAVFDAFWNSPLVLPIRALWRDREADLKGYRLRLAEVAASDEAARHEAAALRRGGLAAEIGVLRLHWTASARLVADPPEKTQRGEPGRWMVGALEPLLASAAREVEITTAYLVPGNGTIVTFGGLVGRGVRVAILTNSLASTNHVSVHGGYARTRPLMLAAGVELYELKPGPEERRTALVVPETGPGALLHGKWFTVDGRLGFIGSYNLDLRSAYLNTETGLVFEAPELVAEMRAVFARQTEPERAYAVSLENGAERWRDNGRLLALREPGAARGRRVVAWVIGRLPIRRQL